MSLNFSNVCSSLLSSATRCCVTAILDRSQTDRIPAILRFPANELCAPVNTFAPNSCDCHPVQTPHANSSANSGDPITRCQPQKIVAVISLLSHRLLCPGRRCHLTVAEPWGSSVTFASHRSDLRSWQVTAECVRAHSCSTLACSVARFNQSVRVGNCVGHARIVQLRSTIAA